MRVCLSVCQCVFSAFIFVYNLSGANGHDWCLVGQEDDRRTSFEAANMALEAPRRRRTMLGDKRAEALEKKMSRKSCKNALWLSYSIAFFLSALRFFVLCSFVSFCRGHATYKPPCRSVGRSVCRSVGLSVCPSVCHTLLFLHFWAF